MHGCMYVYKCMDHLGPPDTVVAGDAYRGKARRHAAAHSHGPAIQLTQLTQLIHQLALLSSYPDPHPDPDPRHLDTRDPLAPLPPVNPLVPSCLLLSLSCKTFHALSLSPFVPSSVHRANCPRTQEYSNSHLGQQEHEHQYQHHDRNHERRAAIPW